MPRHHWTQDHDAWLRRAAQPYTLTLRQLLREFNAAFGLALRPGQLTSHLRGLGLCWRRGSVRQPLRNWTEAEIAWLHAHTRGLTLAQIRAALARVFGTDHALPAIRAALNNRGISTGVDTRIRPGQVPWNKGRTGYIGANRTSFAPGNQPVTTKPLGTLRRNSDGYLEIKIAEPNPWTGAATRYKALHVVVWERAHGPVPPHHAVLFVDSDKDNTALENLRCVHRGVLGILSKRGWHTLPPALRPAAIAAAELELAVTRKRKGKGKSGNEKAES
jgi:hypothetical protein